MNWKQTVTFGAAAVLIATLVLLAFRIKEKEEDKWLNLATIVLGLSVGWLLGIYAKPYGSEEAKFKEIATAISAFLSGYLLAKIDGVIAKLFSPDQILKPVAGFRVIAGFSSLVLALIMTYVARAYM